MKTAPFYKFPANQAALIFHPDYGSRAEGCGLLAIVAPSSTPGLVYVAVMAVKGDERRIVTGPCVEKNEKAWARLFKISEDWTCSTSKLLSQSDSWSHPTSSPDNLIDLLTGGHGQ